MRHFTLVLMVMCASVVAGSYDLRPNESFSTYQARMQILLKAEKAWINPDQWELELAAVMPFEALDEHCVAPKGGVLLFHGLSDSPHALRDVANQLGAQCWQTRVMLLPGHGTTETALIDVSRDDWRQFVAGAIDQFSEEIAGEVYLGGFSTGGALVLDWWLSQTSSKRAEVQGMVLFSPLFKINSGIDWLSVYLAPWVTWLDHYPNDDYAKYASIPVPAIREVYSLVKEMREKLEHRDVTVPIWLAFSQEDATVDAQVTLEAFANSMPNIASRAVLYDVSVQSENGARITTRNAMWPEQQIAGMSHAGILVSPTNAYYGMQGSMRNCSWYYGDSDRYPICRQTQSQWFGEKGPWLEGKSDAPARLSWNPEFPWLINQLTHWLDKGEKSAQ